MPTAPPYTPRNWQPLRRAGLVAALLRLLLRAARRAMPPHDRGPQVFVAGTRALMAKSARWMPKLPAEVRVDSFPIGEIAAHWIDAPGVSQQRVLFYLQGGGYIAGGPLTTHRDLLWRLSQAADCRVLAIEYALAPEATYPQASNQVLAAWQFLLDRYPRESLALGGDSAGGCLALSSALRLRDAGIALPAAICLLSPETDLTGSGASAIYNARRDVIIPAASIRMVGQLYAGSASLEDPYVSPVFGQFDGFPPTLLQVGGEEVFLDDSRRVAQKLRAAGVPVLFDIWRGLPHVWQGFASLLPEARAAIDDIGRFLRSQLRG